MMRALIKDKNYLLFLLFLGAVACSKSPSKIQNIEPQIESKPLTNTDTSEALPETSSQKNTQSTKDLLESLNGAWASTCRDLDSKNKNTSEKDILVIQPKDEKMIIKFYSLSFDNTRSCEQSKFLKGIEANFTIEKAGDGHAEREAALALDTVDENLSLEKTENILLVLASPKNSNHTGRILFEIMDNQRAFIRLQIDEWKDLLNSLDENHDAVLIELNALAQEKDLGKKRIPYTRAQAFSRAKPEDLELIQE